jgi:hypothetical protein
MSKRWNTIHKAATDNAGCDSAYNLIAVINTRGRSQQAQPLQVRNGGTVRLLIVPLAPQVAFIWLIRQSVSIRDENRPLLLIQN